MSPNEGSNLQGVFHKSLVDWSGRRIFMITILAVKTNVSKQSLGFVLRLLARSLKKGDEICGVTTHCHWKLA